MDTNPLEKLGTEDETPTFILRQSIATIAADPMLMFATELRADHHTSSPREQKCTVWLRTKGPGWQARFRRPKRLPGRWWDSRLKIPGAVIRFTVPRYDSDHIRVFMLSEVEGLILQNISVDEDTKTAGHTIWSSGAGPRMDTPEYGAWIDAVNDLRELITYRTVQGATVRR